MDYRNLVLHSPCTASNLHDLRDAVWMVLAGSISAAIIQPIVRLSMMPLYTLALTSPLGAV